MTKERISEYDASADGNTDVNGTNIAEGCAPSGINNAIREVMAALKRFETGADGDSLTVGGNLVVSGSTSANNATVGGTLVVTGATTFSGNVVISGSTTATTVSTTVVQSDTINEKTSAAGVTVDGVLLKDTTVTANTIKASGTSSSQGEVQLFEDTDNGTNYVALKAPASIASNVTWTLPNADGTADQVLKTDGSGGLGWAASGSGAEIGTLQQFHKSDFITPDSGFPDSTWLKADGSVVSQSTYSDLFDKVGLQPDGVYNLVRRQGVTADLFAGIIFGNNLYVTAGDNGLMYTSTDSITWTARTSGTTTLDIYALTYGNNLYVYGGQQGILRTSTDGTTWTARTSGTATTAYITCLTFGNNLYVYGNSVGGIRSSTDGITWTARTSGTAVEIKSLAYGGGVYVYGDASGNIRSSTDAITWTARTSLIGPNVGGIGKIVYGDGLFVGAVASNGSMLTSTDGTTWVERQVNFYPADLAYGDGAYLCSSSSLDGAYYSTDGINWSPTGNITSYVCAGGGNFVTNVRYYIASSPKYTYNTSTEFALPLANVADMTDNQFATYIKATT